MTTQPIYQDNDQRSVSPVTQDEMGASYCLTWGNQSVVLVFQHGNPQTMGINGITNEMLYVLLEHRITELNNRMPCDENEAALGCIRAARMAQEHRQIRLATQ